MNDPKQSNEELMGRAQKGEEEAFNSRIDTLMEQVKQAEDGDIIAFSQLVSLLNKKVWNICYRFAGNKEDAEEWASDVFYKVYQNRRTYQVGRPAMPWVMTIARNHCIDQLRRRRPWLFVEDEENFPAEEEVAINPEVIAILKERKSIVRKCLNKLPEKDRLVLILFYYEYFNYWQLADVLFEPMKGWSESDFVKAGFVLNALSRDENGVIVLPSNRPVELGRNLDECAETIRSGGYINAVKDAIQVALLREENRGSEKLCKRLNEAVENKIITKEEADVLFQKLEKVRKAYATARMRVKRAEKKLRKCVEASGLGPNEK